jgi:hypothetical protein
VLEWDLSPVTAHLWLTTLYQAASSRSSRRPSDLKHEVTDTPQSPRSEQYGVADSARPVPDLSCFGSECATSEWQQLPVTVTPSYERREGDENTPKCPSPASSDVCAVHRRSEHGTGCSECFVHITQFSQQEFIQIVRVCISSSALMLLDK